jgi:hypothetical protein
MFKTEWLHGACGHFDHFMLNDDKVTGSIVPTGTMLFVRKFITSAGGRAYLSVSAQRPNFDITSVNFVCGYDVRGFAKRL